MPKSIRTNSNTQNTTNGTLATFKAGDSVLCPSLSNSPFVLTADPYGKIEGEAVKSMARLAHDATNTWEDLLRAQLDIINEPLAMTGYSKIGEQ